ncbi:alpha/beta hydrolase [Streptomyces sp. A7024]|uniref:Alpha/beta hydrolase n=1 Tax=Streptomyces coryli TaxID=1128680 RepID=A0A6G4U3S8_9ACTN|nr:alpha/beta hydrolase [Streptomyces coryli]NGN65947.1 alpha/beta hydrolase [Streptomyces coryli]
MPFVSTDTGQVHYEIDGDGPGLVLVHGVGGDAQKVFGNVVDQFSGEHTVVRPNLSGSGRTTDDGAELSLPALVGQVEAATRAAVTGPVDLFGFSLGAAVAAATAATHPGLVRRLILLGGVADMTGPRAGLGFGLWRDLAATDFELFKRFAALQGFSPAVLDGFGHDGLAWSLKTDTWPPGTRRQIDLAARIDIRELLPAIQVPTLVIGLGADQIAPIEQSHLLHSAIPGSRLAEIDGAGHLDWLTDPTPVVKLVQDFLTTDPA